MRVLLVYVWFVNGAFAPDVEIQPWSSNFSYEQCKEVAEGVTRALTKARLYCHVQHPGETTESIITFYQKLRWFKQVRMLQITGAAS
jgi:hypothetical protein